MATLKEVHTLVHALDKAEKKNLSILIEAMGGKGRQRYAKSLRIFNKQKEFDAIALKQRLSVSLAGMSLTEANDYFFGFICKLLTSNLMPRAGNLGLLKDLTLVETFVSKGLFDAADKFLQPLLAKLKKGNSFGLLARGRELESIILASNQRTQFEFKKRIASVQERIQNANDHLQYLQIVLINQRYLETVQLIGDPRQKSHLQAYEHIYKDPIWRLNYSQVSLQTFTMFAPIKVEIMAIVGGRQRAINEAQIALEEFYKRFDVRDHYVAAFYLLDSMAFDSVAEKKVATIQWVIQELHKLLTYCRQAAVSQKMQATIMYAELSFYLISGNFQKGIKRLDEWMKDDKYAQWQEAPLAYTNYMVAARLYHLNGQPEKAIDYLLLMRGNEKTFHISMQNAYRFLSLICYYQLGNFSLVSSTCDSIYKSLLKHDKLYAPERALLRFTRKNGSLEKIKAGMVQLHSTLTELSKDPLNASFFQYGDYLHWLETEMRKKR